jgi:hypothetical protein
MEQPPASPRFVGIDVSKDRLDVHVRPSGRSFTVPRDGAGLERLLADLCGHDELALIVLEATGGFELTVAAALADAGLPLAVVNPRQIRDFARATGRLAKPTPSTRRSSRSSPNASAPSRARSPELMRKPSPNSSPGAARSSR